MMRIFTKIFAAIGFLVVSSLVTGIVIGLWFSTEEKAPLPDRMVLSFDFARPVLEQGDADPLSAALGNDRISLQTLISALDRARKDDRVAGFVATVSEVELEPAQVEEVRAALKRFRDSGKFTLAYADSFGEGGSGNRPYWLASAFDDIWLQPLGSLGLSGPALSVPFARAGLERLGITADMHERYEYKGAADTFTKTNMPAPIRENYQKLLVDIKTRIVADIAESRKLAPNDVVALMDRGSLLTNDILKAKLIDHIGYRDEFDAQAKTKGGEGAEEIDLVDYAQDVQPLSDTDEATKIALIYVNGPIVRLDDDTGPFGERDTISAETLVAALQQATEDEEIKAIVLRVNSPGGSVTASESIHRAIVQAKAAGKYVVVSMGATAASGGYWIATAADKIIADPTTITGSIGVVSGKIVFGDLAKKLGVNFEDVTTSAKGGMWSSTRTFTPEEMKTVDAQLDDIYSAFLSHVADGRHLPKDKLDALARGRVWSGQSAKEVGLVDELGGMRTGFEAIRTHLKLEAEAPLSAIVLPQPESRAKHLLKLLRAYIAMPALQPLSFEGLFSQVQTHLDAQPKVNLYSPMIEIR